MTRYARSVNGQSMPANDARLAGQKPWLERLPSDIGTLLDVGAGAGSHSAFFAARGVTVTAIDADAENFRHHETVEFAAANVMTWDDLRTFDAVFCSHVIEHAPDTAAFFRALAARVRDGGYLVVVAPAFEGIVCDEHWNVGWTTSQLAMTLVANGFDCSDAVFQTVQQNVCGWGVKREIADTAFQVAASTPYLPAGMVEQIFSSGDGNLHIPELSYADATAGWPRPRGVALEEPGFAMEDALHLTFGEGGRADLLVTFDPPVKLGTGVMRIFVLQEGGGDLRVALDAHPGEKFGVTADLYLDNRAGATVREARAVDFANAAGFDFDHITKVVFGGRGRAGKVCCWIYIDGAPVRQSGSANAPAASNRTAAQPRRAEDKAWATLESEVYFLRNRSARLERDLEILKAETEAAPSREALRDMLRWALTELERERGGNTMLKPNASSVEFPDREDLANLLARALSRISLLQSAVVEQPRASAASKGGR